MDKAQVIKYIPITILFISISSITGFIKMTLGFQIANTTFWWLIHAAILFLYFQYKRHFADQKDEYNMQYIMLYLIYNGLQSVRGCFIAENYWDWKGLVTNMMALTLPIVAYAATNMKVVQLLLTFYLKYTLPLFIIFAFLITKDAYGFYLVPIGFLLLFLPFLTFKWKIVLISITILVLTADLGARSNVIKFLLPLIFLVIYYARGIISVKLLNFTRIVFLILPIVLFFLAVYDIFNVFNIGEYVKDDFVEIKKDQTGEVIEDNLKADTRTLLYIEVLQTASKFDTWIFGRSPARGNETELFAALAEISGRAERIGNEVAILNVFTWTGLIGVLFYLIIFSKASYLAINRSRSIFMKILGLFIAFRWMYAWVEDINNFSLTNYFIWFMIGICFSRTFRSLSDRQIANWVRGVFDFQYRKRQRIQLKRWTRI